MLIVQLVVWIRLQVGIDLKAFYNASCSVFLDLCRKEQLLEIAEHYGVALQEGMFQDELKMFVLLICKRCVTEGTCSRVPC